MQLHPIGSDVNCRLAERYEDVLRYRRTRTSVVRPALARLLHRLANWVEGRIEHHSASFNPAHLGVRAGIRTATEGAPRER